MIVTILIIEFDNFRINVRSFHTTGGRRFIFDFYVR